MSAILVVMLVISAIVVSNVVYTMIFKHHIWSGQDVLHSKIRSSIVNTSVEAKRGNIYDRNHNVIAHQIPAYTVVAYLDDSIVDENGDPDYVSDPKKTAKELKKYLPNIDEKQVAQILENAIKYSPAGTAIDVAVGTDGECTTVSFADEGCGVPEELREIGRAHV